MYVGIWRGRTPGKSRPHDCWVPISGWNIPSYTYHDISHNLSEISTPIIRHIFPALCVWIYFLYWKKQKMQILFYILQLIINWARYSDKWRKYFLMHNHILSTMYIRKCLLHLSVSAEANTYFWSKGHKKDLIVS